MRKRGKFEAPPVPRSSRRKMNIHLQMMVTSAVSMVLCCSMLLGTTMAWFSDTIVSAANLITIGELKVAAYCDGYSLKNSSRPIFGNSNARSAEVWMPDHFEVRELTVKNEGNIPLNYSLNFLTQETDLEPAKYFHIYVLDGTLDRNQELTIEDIRKNWTPVDGTLYEILVNKSSVFTGSLEAATETESTSQSFNIALCMDTDCSSDIQGARISLNIQLHAYQRNATDLEIPTELPESDKTDEAADPDNQSDDDASQTPSPDSQNDDDNSQTSKSVNQNNKDASQTPNSDNQNDEDASQTPDSDEQNDEDASQTPDPDDQNDEDASQTPDPDDQNDEDASQTPNSDEQNNEDASQTPSPSSQSDGIENQSSAPEGQSIGENEQSNMPEGQSEEGNETPDSEITAAQ